jgi:aryl-alcohol dehydrogenase-like predicted oxidoreductase
MKYRTLGHTGISVANLALGTMGFGTETPEDEALTVIDAYVEAGGNVLDTADVYGGGASETTLGRWFASRPADIADRIVLATKGRFGVGSDINDVGLSRRHLDRTLSASLERLGRDTVDVYQLHGWDPLTPIEETLSFLDDATRAGKINHYGLSNFTGWRLQLAVSTSKAMGVRPPVSIQSQYSLVSRELEFEVVPAAIYNNVAILPWSPLASGFLTGKYQRNAEAPSNARGGSGDPMFEHIINDLTAREQNWEVLDVLRAVADDHGVTQAEAALSWVTNQPGVALSIIGARNLDQLRKNLGAADLHLSGESTALLNKVSEPHPNDYPYGPFGRKQVDRYVDSSEQVLGELWAPLQHDAQPPPADSHP